MTTDSTKQNTKQKQVGFTKGDPRINRKGRIASTKSKQANIRSKMLGKAEDVVNILHEVILKGTLDGEQIPLKTRIEMIKVFLPYVLPQLKAIEITNDSDSDKDKDKTRPLIVNVSTNVTTNNNSSPNKGKEKVIEHKEGNETSPMLSIGLSSRNNSDKAGIEDATLLSEDKGKLEQLAEALSKVSFSSD